MRYQRVLLCAAALAVAIPARMMMAQVQQAPPDVPTFRVTSTLVFLDVTVLDKKGHPVVSGLTKDDFTITEDKKPQTIFSFEAPESHVMGTQAGDDNPDGKAPVTIFVLDLLNSSFQDFAFIRYEAKQFLLAQPAQLAAPAELMVVGDQSLELLQGYTRSRADLLYALEHLPAALPFKKMNEEFYWDRFGQSLDALQQIALQNKGVPGRKNVVWVGHGGPSVNLFSPDLTGAEVEDLKQYVHMTTNMLVDARISLFVIYPGLNVASRRVSLSEMEADSDLGDDDPFAGDINFGVFVNATGGKLFFRRNDVDMEMARSERMGSEYYTLTYMPQDVPSDGKFRRIRVTLRNRNLRVVTKAGYFAPDGKKFVDPRQQTMINVAEAASSTIPFKALDFAVGDVLRHPDTRSAQFVVRLKGKHLGWTASGDGRSSANLVVAAVSRSGDGSIVASRLEHVSITSGIQDATRRGEAVALLPLSIRIPRKTKTVRVVIEAEVGGRIGATEVDRKTIDAAPAAPTPEPKLTRHRPEYVRPAPAPSGNNP